MKGILFTAISAFAFLFSSNALAADPGDEATAYWAKVLQAHVSDEGMVDYAAIQKDPNFQRAIDLYADQKPTSSWSSDDAMAFWINVYNAFTVKLIVDNYPLNSITDLKDPWDQKFIVLKGEKFSLNQIEHEILRPVYKDPRVHFAVNCASFSCPKLLNEPIYAEKLNSQLNQLSKGFLADSKRNKISTNKAELSKIFEWFSEDFGGATGVVDFINVHSNFKVSSPSQLTYLEYDWSLNKK